MSSFGMSFEKENALLQKMARLGVKEEEIMERFIRSSGPGGQNVNKTSTCVYLKHLPSGIEVKCQKERSQALNRFIARRLLVNKIEAVIFKELSEEKRRIAKICRQKRKRSKKAKLMVLEAKRRQSEKKRLRQKRLDFEAL